jgi:hypothetical protein
MILEEAVEKSIWAPGHQLSVENRRWLTACPPSDGLHFLLPDDEAHKEWGRQLATQLRADGVDARLDTGIPGDQLPGRTSFAGNMV